MRVSTILSVLGASAVAVAQNASMNASMSICDKYTMALFNVSNSTTQWNLLTALVNRAVVGNQTAGVTGIVTTNGVVVAGDPSVLNATVNLQKYFDGSLASSNRDNKSVAVNFLDGGGATPLMKNMPANDTTSNQYFLLTHLYEYFGYLLNCSAYNTAGFPAYGGETSMYEVHKFMDLSDAEVTYFIQEVALAGASFGVSGEDLMTIGGALGTLFNRKCSPPVAILPGESAELQSICIAEDCMAAQNASCNLYQAAVSPSASMSDNVYTSKPTEQPAATGTDATGTRTTSSGSSSATKSGAAVAVVADGFRPFLGAAGLAAVVMAL